MGPAILFLVTFVIANLISSVDVWFLDFPLLLCVLLSRLCFSRNQPILQCPVYLWYFLMKLS